MYICLFIVWGHGLCGGQRTTFGNGLSIYCGFWELQSGCQFKHGKGLLPEPSCQHCTHFLHSLACYWTSRQFYILITVTRAAANMVCKFPQDVLTQSVLQLGTWSGISGPHGSSDFHPLRHLHTNFALSKFPHTLARICGHLSA